MCCAEFIVKYVLFGANFVFTLAGLALIGAGIAALVQLNEILELIPVNINAIPISIIVLGSFVFVIAFCGCCGAIKESRCLLILYSLCMAILAAGKIYLAVVLFSALDDLENTVTGWVNDAFLDQNLRPAFQVLETLFECCGTTGPDSYLTPLPASCCASVPAGGTCQADDAFGGCAVRLSSYFETFGEAIAFGVAAVISVEIVAIVFALFLCWSVRNKRY